MWSSSGLKFCTFLTQKANSPFPGQPNHSNTQVYKRLFHCWVWKFTPDLGHFSEVSDILQSSSADGVKILLFTLDTKVRSSWLSLTNFKSVKTIKVIICKIVGKRGGGCECYGGFLWALGALGDVSSRGRTASLLCCSYVCVFLSDVQIS